MSINRISEVVENSFVTNDNFLLKVRFEEQPVPGQFVMLSMVDGRTDPYLPRPISVFDWNDGVLSLLIKVVGKGTKLLSQMKKGEKVRIVGHLGNSFPDNDGTVFFVGGGIGVAPLLYTAKRSKAAKKVFFLGFQNKYSVACRELFEDVGEVVICTDDGSCGIKGYPHHQLQKRLEAGDVPDLVCSVGPEIMMESVQKVVSEYKNTDIYHSLEARMGCGIGACLGCRVETKGGVYLVCKDGPVFNGKDIY